MNILLYSLFCYLIFLCTVLYPSDYTYRLATNADIGKIVYVINNHASKDHTKIVILPEVFRESAVTKDVRLGRLFVATDKNNNIVAFKKAFHITEQSEFEDITTNELRCSGPNRTFVDAHIFNKEDKQLEKIDFSHLVPVMLNNSTIIYFGGDYTITAYREKGINSQLTKTALQSIQETIIGHIQTNPSKQLVLIYGLTKSNAGEGGGIDRTLSIVRAFTTFAYTIAEKILCISNMPITHSQFESFMPTFDPKDTECTPLGDDQAIAGYGNVLQFPIKNSKEKS